MLVSNSFHPGQQIRPAAQGVEPAPQQTVQSQPTPCFTMISTISHGSLAAAYQTLRAAPVAALGEPAILSGLGVPAALAAYGEMTGAAETD